MAIDTTTKARRSRIEPPSLRAKRSDPENRPRRFKDRFVASFPAMTGPFQSQIVALYEAAGLLNRAAVAET